MKRNFLYLIITILSIVSCSEEKDNLPNVDNPYEREIMNLINDFRESQGKKRLKASTYIKKYTDEHNNYMISRGGISHDKYSIRIKPIQKEFGSYYVTENVAYNFSTNPKDVVEMWKNSPGHRRNMLGKSGVNYSSLYVSATKAKNGAWYYTAIFV